MKIERISAELLNENRKQIRKEAVKKARRPRYREGCLYREKVRAGWSYRQRVGVSDAGRSGGLRSSTIMASGPDAEVQTDKSVRIGYG